MPATLFDLIMSLAKTVLPITFGIVLLYDMILLILWDSWGATHVVVND